jgi:hypothetical protein
MAAAVACGLFATAGLTTAVVSTQAQPPTPPTGALTLMQRDRDARFQFIDVPPRQGDRRPPTPGDGFLITGAVRDQAGRRVGRLHAVFVITNARREEAQGSATFILSDGHIVISGAETRARVDHFAITGGTGRYTGARGTFQVTEGRRSTAFLFTFLG